MLGEDACPHGHSGLHFCFPVRRREGTPFPRNEMAWKFTVTSFAAGLLGVFTWPRVAGIAAENRSLSLSGTGKSLAWGSPGPAGTATVVVSLNRHNVSVRLPSKHLYAHAHGLVRRQLLPEKLVFQWGSSSWRDTELRRLRISVVSVLCHK